MGCLLCPHMPAPVLAQARQADAVAASHPRASKVYKLPGVGAPGFPVSIYPPASSKTVNTVGRCPSTSGLRPPGHGTRPVAVAIAVGFERKSFMDDLRTSDRAMWPQVLSDWQNGYAPQPTSKVPVLYAGPLAARWPTTLAYRTSWAWSGVAVPPWLLRPMQSFSGTRNGRAYRASSSSSTGEVGSRSI